MQVVRGDEVMRKVSVEQTKGLGTCFATFAHSPFFQVFDAYYLHLAKKKNLARGT